MRSSHLDLLENSESGDRIRLALDAFNMGVWDWNLETNDLIWDSTLYEIYGIDPGKGPITYSDFASCVLLEDLPQIQQAITESITEGRPIQFSFRIRHPLKGIRYIQTVGKATRNSVGKAIRMTGLNWDISEQELLKKEIQSERRHQEERLKILESMVESSKDFMGYLDAHGQPLFLNRALKELCGANSLPTLLELMDSESARRIQTEAIPQVGLGHTWGGEIRLANQKTSELVAVVARLFPIISESSEQWMVGLLAEDARDRVRTEQSMMESSRLAGLGQMAAQIAHEINNPLAIISGKSQLIRHRLEEAEVDRHRIHEYCDSIDKTVYRVTRIIRGLKSLSRQDSTAGTQKSSVKSLIEEVVELCAERFRNSGISLVSSIEEDCEIDVRPVQIQQVILNLLNNAYDALCGQSASWVEITSKKREASLQISVTDSGLGIPEPILARLMEPFFTTKEVGKGTGLGLSTSKAIIESHGGSFYYDRDSAHTRFTISLPFKVKPRPTDR